MAGRIENDRGVEEPPITVLRWSYSGGRRMRKEGEGGSYPAQQGGFSRLAGANAQIPGNSIEWQPSLLPEVWGLCQRLHRLLHFFLELPVAFCLRIWWGVVSVQMREKTPLAIAGEKGP